jgi:hypothetical protein
MSAELDLAVYLLSSGAPAYLLTVDGKGRPDQGRRAVGAEEHPIHNGADRLGTRNAK